MVDHTTVAGMDLDGDSAPRKDTAVSRAGRRRRLFALRLLAAFLVALGLIGAVQYVLEARAIKSQLLRDRTAAFEAEAAHIEVHLFEDGVTETGLTAVADGLHHIQLRPGIRSLRLIDPSGEVLAAGDPTLVGSRRWSPAIEAAIRSGTVHSGIVASPSGEVFEYVGRVDSPEGSLGFEAIADASVLDAFLTDLRKAILFNLLIGLALGLPVFYLAGGRRLSDRYEQVELTQEERKMMLDHTVSAAEDERTRLAADLHDGPIQRLSALGYGLERARMSLERGRPSEGAERIASLQRNLGAEVDGLRRMMVDLRPPALDERGLQAAVVDYVDEFARRIGVKASADVVVHRRLDPSVETVVYRVIQEALTNVAKHARASTARVRLHDSNGQVRLEVADDGEGFDAVGASAQAQGHFGLAVMRERVEIVGGRWIVRSEPGKGTTVAAVMPALTRSS